MIALQVAFLQGDGELIDVQEFTDDGLTRQNIIDKMHFAYDGDLDTEDYQLVEDLDIAGLREKTDGFATIIELSGSELIADIIIGHSKNIKAASNFLRKSD